MGTRWRGLLAPLGTSTGDGRRFLASGVSHRELPLPLKWQRSDEPGHDEAVVIGTIDTIDLSETEAWGEGELFDDVDPAEMPRLAEDVAEAKHLVTSRIIGPSVDPGAAEAVLAEVGSDEPITEERLDELLEQAWETGEDPQIELLFTMYEIAAATLVTVPAFAECGPFELIAQEPVTAAVQSSGWEDLPLAARDREWNPQEAADRLAELCDLDGEDPDWSRYAGGFLQLDGDADPASREAYAHGLVDVVDGQAVIVPAAVDAAAAVVNDPDSGLSDEDREGMREVLSGLYPRMAAEFDDESITAPWESDTGEASRLAVLTAAAGPQVPAGYFDNPALAQVTPITIGEPDEQGWRRVFGHVAAFGVCHVGIREACATAPTTAREYLDFHRYQATASGVQLPVPAGRITAGHGAMFNTCSCCRGNDDHACNRLSAGGAIAHHDVMRAVAYVRAGEDEHGIWVAGIVAPEADERDLAVLGRQKVSGDWRDIGGNLELVEVLALAREKPGFPLPRTSLANGRQRSLVAAGAVRPQLAGPRPVPNAALDRLSTDLDYQRLGREVAAALAPLVTAPPVDTPHGEVEQERARLAVELAAEIDQVVANQRAADARALLDEMELTDAL